MNLSDSQRHYRFLFRISKGNATETEAALYDKLKAVAGADKFWKKSTWSKVSDSSSHDKEERKTRSIWGLCEWYNMAKKGDFKVNNTKGDKNTAPYNKWVDAECSNYTNGTCHSNAKRVLKKCCKHQYENRKCQQAATFMMRLPTCATMTTYTAKASSNATDFNSTIMTFVDATDASKKIYQECTQQGYETHHCKEMFAIINHCKTTKPCSGEAGESDAFFGCLLSTPWTVNSTKEDFLKMLKN